MPMPFIPGRNPIQRDEQEMDKPSTIKRRNNFRVLHTSTHKLYTSTHLSILYALGETHEPDLAQCQGVPLVPSLRGCGVNRPSA